MTEEQNKPAAAYADDQAPAGGTPSNDGTHGTPSNGTPTSSAAAVLAARPAERKPFFNSQTLAFLGLMTALSTILYHLKFNLPTIFPSFLEVQFSDLPILIAGFATGPIGGIFVTVTRFLLKLPFTSTAAVGELADLIIGLSLVVPASLIYMKKRNIKGAVLGIVAGALIGTVVAILANWLLLIPFYLEFFFKGNWAPLLGMCKPIFPNITQENFYNYYLPLTVLPFNLIRFMICGAVTFFSYKQLRKLINRMAGEIDYMHSKSWRFVLPGIFFPAAGLTLSLVWKEERKEDATSALVGFVIGVCILVLIAFLVWGVPWIKSW